MRKIISLICCICICILAIPVTPLVSASGLSGSVDVSVSTAETPAVFYDSDTASFMIEVTNNSADTAVCDIEYIVSYKNYNYDSYKTVVDTKTVKSLKRQSREIGVSEVFSDTLYLPMANEKYGLYNLKVAVKSRGSTVAEKNFPFAKSTVSEKQNKTFGASIHLTRYADADIVFNMMKNAGMGIARDDFNWDKYELKAGEYKLDALQTKTLEKAKKYGFEMLAILTGHNKLYRNNSEYSSIPSNSTYDESGKTYADAYKAYAESFVQEPLVKDIVTMVEIINEPLGVIDIEAETTAQKTESYKVGRLYAQAVKSGYEGVKAKASSIKVGAFSAFMLGYQAEYFIDGALSVMDKQYYDAFTIHDYKERGTDGDPEPGYSPGVGENWFSFLDGAVATVERFDNLVSGNMKAPMSEKNYNFLNEERWYTERGFSTDDKPDGSSNKSNNPYYDQALNLVRSKIVTDAYNGGSMKDKTWIYDFSDDNAVGNIRESSFGIVESHLDENPYNPKPAYIAVANYNSLVADATKCEKVDGDDIYEANGDYIYKYTCPERTVYIPYHTKGDIPGEVLELEFEKIGKGQETHIYDFWGNELKESDIYKNGKYQLTKQPYYICVGEPVNRNVKHKSVADATIDKVTVEGCISSGDRGRNVSLVVLSPGEELTSTSVATSLYFGQRETDENGMFKFEFGVPRQEAAYKAYVRADDNSVPLSFNIASGRTQKISISLMKDILKLKNDDLKEVDLSKVSALVEYTTTDKAIPYKLYCALYKDNMLVDIVSLEDRAESATDGSKVYPLTFSNGVETDFNRISLFMLESDNTLKTLCAAHTINK